MKILRRLAFAGFLLLASTASADVAGTYQVTQETPMGAMDSVVTINADGTGVVAGMMGENPFENAVVDGNKVSWKMTVNGPMGEMEMSWSGTVDGDAFSGTVTNMMGESTFSGTRQEPAQEE